MHSPVLNVPEQRFHHPLGILIFMTVAFRTSVGDHDLPVFLKKIPACERNVRGLIETCCARPTRDIRGGGGEYCAINVIR